MLTALQGVWFVIRWTMGANPIDARLVGVLVASVVAGLALGRGAVPPDPGTHRQLTILRLTLIALGIECVAVFVQPTLGWDEAYVMRAARAMAEGGFARLIESYSENAWLGLRHPPLGPALFGLGVRLFGEGTTGPRLIAAAFAAVAVAATAWIAREQHGDDVGRRAGWMLLGFPLFVRVGCVAMTDMLLTCFFTLTVALAIHRARRGGPNAGVALGLLAGATFLTKYTGILVVPVLLAAYATRGALAARRAEIVTALAVAAAVAGAWGGILFSTGGLSTQLGWLSQAAGVSARGFFGPYSAGETLLTKLPSAVGLYGVVLIAAGALVVRRGGAWFLAAWVALVSVPLLLTLPDNRYFLPAFPAFAILAAHGAARLFREPARVLWLSLGLCLLTVVFYAVMPNREAVFFFDTSGRGDSRVEIGALATRVELPQVVQDHLADRHGATFEVGAADRSIDVVVEGRQVAAEPEAAAAFEERLHLLRHLVEQAPPEAAELRVTLELANADLEQEGQVHELPVGQQTIVAGRRAVSDVLPEMP